MQYALKKIKKNWAWIKLIINTFITVILKICLKLRSPSPAKQAPGAGRGSCTPSAAVPPVPRHNLLLHPRENAAPDVWWARAGSNRCLSVATASPTWSKQETATARLSYFRRRWGATLADVLLMDTEVKQMLWAPWLHVGKVPELQQKQILLPCTPFCLTFLDFGSMMSAYSTIGSFSNSHTLCQCFPLVLAQHTAPLTVLTQTCWERLGNSLGSKQHAQLLKQRQHQNQ